MKTSSSSMGRRVASGVLLAGAVIMGASGKKPLQLVFNVDTDLSMQSEYASLADRLTRTEGQLSSTYDPITAVYATFNDKPGPCDGDPSPSQPNWKPVNPANYCVRIESKPTSMEEAAQMLSRQTAFESGGNVNQDALGAIVYISANPAITDWNPSADRVVITMTQQKWRWDTEGTQWQDNCPYLIENRNGTIADCSKEWYYSPQNVAGHVSQSGVAQLVLSKYVDNYRVLFNNLGYPKSHSLPMDSDVSTIARAILRAQEPTGAWTDP